MDWFERIFGFKENDKNIKKYIEFSGEKLYSSANDTEFNMGDLEVVSLRALKERLPLANNKQSIKFREVYGNVVDFHIKQENALFQVASQFNLLEMYRPENTRQMGISIYQYDKTQGPACAMACAAGTLFRNYFTNINTLQDIQTIFFNKYWDMKNGYTLFRNTEDFEKMIIGNEEIIKDSLSVGIQWNTEVINAGHNVSQIYCSAIPVSYNEKTPVYEIELFAKLILEAAYEATFIAAILNEESNDLYLTFLGGGAFGNKKEWILSAIEKNLEKYKNYNLNVRIINYSMIPDMDIKELVDKYKN